MQNKKEFILSLKTLLDLDLSNEITLKENSISLNLSNGTNVKIHVLEI